MKKKNILWIDDFDTNSSTNTVTNVRKNIDKEHRFLRIFDDRYKDVVEIKESLFDGIKYIFEHRGEYDCVILDVDMNRNLQIDAREYTEKGKIWKKFFDYVYIPKEEKINEGNKIEYSDKITEDIQKYAGFYLVVLLMSLGFPKERIIVFTAFGDDNNATTDDNDFDDDKNKEDRTKSWIEKFANAAINVPKIINKGETFYKSEGSSILHNELNEHLNGLYKNDYYLTRIFLYKIYNAFEEYTKILDEKYNSKEYKCMFNYICNDKTKKVDKQKILDLLENTIYYLPCIEPDSDKNKIYYSAIKQFAEPFEANYDTNKVDKCLNFRVMKLYRNWSAHNLFKNKEINDKLFRYFVFLEVLMFIQQKYEDKQEYEEYLLFEEKYLSELWKKFSFFFEYNKIITDNEILEKLQKLNWKKCEEWKSFPDNMINVYDNYGKRKIVPNIDGKPQKVQVNYNYLIDAFLNSFIDNDINYNNNGCTTNYKLSDNCKGIYKELFLYGYSLMEETLL